MTRARSASEKKASSSAKPKAEAVAKTPAPARTPAEHLSALDPDWAELTRRSPPFEPVDGPEKEPYESLIHAIAHQQLHGKAAQTILRRFRALFPGDVFPAPEHVLALEEAALRGCGFSGSKTAAILDVCRKTQEGVVPSRAEAAALTDAELIARLTAVRGVGRWTVEMLLIFSLGRPDVLPVDDFGVREGYRVLKGLSEQPKPKALAEIGLAWAPHRSAAAWYLWRAADAKKAAPDPKAAVKKAAKKKAAAKRAAPSAAVAKKGAAKKGAAKKTVGATRSGKAVKRAAEKG